MLATERRPEAILVDVGPPAPEGWELLRRLCQEGATRDLPIVAYAEAEDGLRVFSLGPGECVATSFDASAVAAWARRLLAGADGEPTVLVLDGEPETAARIRDTLKGARVVAARDRGQARESLRTTPPDLVIVHAGGTLAGLEFLAELGRGGTLRAPVLLLGDREDPPAGSGRAPRRTGPILDPRPLLAEVRRHVSREGAEVHRASL
jgi:DNA-binding response OmpR family regulator